MATPIAFLLFTFFLGFAVVLGAEFNATVQEFFPARATRIAQMKEWLAAQAQSQDSGPVGPVGAVAWRLATGPIRLAGDGIRTQRAQNNPDPERPVEETAEDADAARPATTSGDHSPFFKPS